ncbi:MAG: D,D-dipeptide ABC transporter permease, partial [Nitrospirae bacterium]|nr:D,D-dipeptide ABC transporter permease [Nitrospirota bacterium]
MHLTGKIAGSALIIILILVVFSSVLSPYDPEKIDLDTIKEPPGIKHPFGTDNKGRDILSRVL